MLEVKPLSQKAINSIANTGFLNVWEGAVRSGKTVASSIAWILYIVDSPERDFIMSGKTLGSLYRNVIGGQFGMLSLLGQMGWYGKDKSGNTILKVRLGNKDEKVCYCFGAKDEGSFGPLRGITAGGWYADEINLQPLSFIEEALRRTIVSKDRKHYWTLNPDNPYHWIYSEYIDKYLAEPPGGGYYLWKFTLDDNLAITEERKLELTSQFSGVFYRRFILGERCVAEGAIYDMFGEHNIYDEYDRPLHFNERTLYSRYVAADYGTVNPFHALEVYDDGDTIWIDREYRWDSKSDEAMRTGIAQKTDIEYAKALLDFMGECQSSVVLDPSAESFEVACRRAGIHVIQAKNDVLPGIMAVANLLYKRKIKINRRCKHLIAELTSYMWNQKAALQGEEKPVKENDHGPDALRYFVYTILPGWRIGQPDKGAA